VVLAMAIGSNNNNIHWSYFLSVEEDLERLSRFIEFNQNNYECFSLEIVRLLMAAAAEVDVVCKMICHGFDPGCNADNIIEYREKIIPKYPQLATFTVTAPRYGLNFNPWEEWKHDNNPLWWDAYNSIKHKRHTDYYKANLKNVLNAVAGLFVVCLYLYKEKAELGELIPTPRILRPSMDRYGGVGIGGFETSFIYKLS
jgi:hypothetical protein